MGNDNREWAEQEARLETAKKIEELEAENKRLRSPGKPVVVIHFPDDTEEAKGRFMDRISTAVTENLSGPEIGEVLRFAMDERVGDLVLNASIETLKWCGRSGFYTVESAARWILAVARAVRP